MCHARNDWFWMQCVESYPEYFNNTKADVIEFGSYNINGSIKVFFKNFQSYTGVDWRPQEGWVDIVSLTHELKLDKKFDTVASASMLEHDPYWEKSLENMVTFMKDSSILVLTWGAALNGEHCHAEAPDGKFHCLKFELVIDKLKALGLYIHQARYEGNLYPAVAGQGSGMGEVILIAFRDKKYAKGSQTIDELVPEDRV